MNPGPGNGRYRWWEDVCEYYLLYVQTMQNMVVSSGSFGNI